VKVPPSLLDRRKELLALLDHHEREQQTYQMGLDELEAAINAIAEYEEYGTEGASPGPEAYQPVPPPLFPTLLPQPPTPPAAASGEPGQRAPRRDIKALVLDWLERMAKPETAKEIAKAIEAGVQSTAGALEYWKGQGRATEVDGKWHLVRAQHAPAPALAPGEISAATAAAQLAADPPRQVEAPADAAATSTQDKLIAALKQAGAAGMTDDELAAVGVPYIAVMQYHRLGWMTLDNGRYRLNQQAAQG
jgi:hypothetical protein